MKSYFNTHPFAKIGLIGIPLIGLIVIMESLYPKAVPNGYESFNVAFEFAKTPQQIHVLFGNFSSISFANIKHANYLNFGFAAFYSLFLILYAAKAAKIDRNKWLLLVIPIAVVVFLADCGGNISSLKIANIYSATVAEATLLPLLKNLELYTWLKWGGLALIFFIFAFRGNGVHTIQNLESLALILPLILMIWALTGDPMGITRFALSVIIAFSLLFFRCFMNPDVYKQMQHVTT